MVRPEADTRFREIGGTLYRIFTEDRRDQVLAQARSPESRFHHDGQPALYRSPRPDWAEAAIDIYVRAGGPPRLVFEVEIGPARVLDLRDHPQYAKCGVDARVNLIPWLPERAQGKPASTWALSDLVRRKGAAGMIYNSRREPSRWHLVLFDWTNESVNARLTGRVLSNKSRGL